MDVDLTHIALCAGIGGDTLAAEWAGFTTVQLVEKNPFRQAVLKKHWPGVPIEEDINDFKGKRFRGTITLITAGDPCQPSSLAGKRRGAEDNRYLWPQVFRVLREVRPAWFVGENPPGRITMDFYRVLSDLESQGYETRSFVIPACAVNAPHRRDRLYIVAHNDNHRQSRARVSIPERRPQQANSDPSWGCKAVTHSTGVTKREQADEIKPCPKDREAREGSRRANRRTIADTSEFRQPQPELRGTSPRQEGSKVIKAEPLPLAAGENTRADSPGQYLQADFQDSGGNKTYLGWNENWVKVAATLCGMDDGVPHRVARLEALGDSQVPQQIFPILRGIAMIECGEILQKYEM